MFKELPDLDLKLHREGHSDHSRIETCAKTTMSSFMGLVQVVGGRTIAVDWAVSKAQFQSASAADTPGGLPTF